MDRADDDDVIMLVVASLNILGVAAIGFDSWFAGWVAITTGSISFVIAVAGMWIDLDDFESASASTAAAPAEKSLS